MTPKRKIGIGALVLGSAIAAGIGFTTMASAAPSATAVSAAAAGDTSTTTGDTSTAPTPSGPHSANGVTEEVLTGDTLASVQAAVTAAYPDATIDRIETDADGAVYEAHITQADGSKATVELDASFAITGTETGGGGRGGHGSGPHSANGVTEEVLTGDTATSVQSAVTAAYPDATIDRMETDAEGAAYEAHITLADGSKATVKLDASFTVTGTETGR